MASYGWTHKLEAPVLNGNDIEVATPGVNNPDCDNTAIEVAVDGREILAGDFTAVAGDDVVTVTNSTETVWPVGVDVYVYAPSKALTGENAGAALDQINANTAAIDALEARVAALEGAPAADAMSDDDDEDEWVEDDEVDETTGAKTKAKAKKRGKK